MHQINSKQSDLMKLINLLTQFVKLVILSNSGLKKVEAINESTSYLEIIREGNFNCNYYNQPW